MGQTLPKVILAALAVSAFRPSDRASDQAALKPFAGLVGDWKGTGQPQRGSARGAWTESAGWAWSLTKDSAALKLDVTKGKYLRSMSLRPGDADDRFVMEAVLADGTKREFSGKIGAKKVLVLTPTKEKEVESGLAKVTITPLHDTRFLMLLEAKGPGGDLVKLGEVGYTRQGVAFAAGDSSPVCIVTDGRGTIPVTHKGKTYYVCCSGCKDLFNDDPEAVLADAEKRLKAK